MTWGHCCLKGSIITQKNKLLFILSMEILGDERTPVCILNSLPRHILQISFSAVFASLHVVSSAENISKCYLFVSRQASYRQ